MLHCRLFPSRNSRCLADPSVPCCATHRTAQISCKSSTPAKVYPVIIIGSGASGGMAAWNLTRKGIDVAACSTPARSSIAARYWTHVRPWEARERHGARRDAAGVLPRHEGAAVLHAARPAVRPDRVWGHGGKTNVWGRVSLRLSDLDFKGAERDGWEIPWPICLQGHRAVLRPGRAADRRLRRDRRLGLAAGQQVPAAAARAALRRAAAAEGRRAASASRSSPAAAPT